VQVLYSIFLTFYGDQCIQNISTKRETFEKALWYVVFLRELFEENHLASQTLANRVFVTLRKAILIGYLYPGERLIEEDLAQELGISRTPIRSAILRLERENLIVSTPQKGSRVSKLSPREVEEGYMIMGILQGFAAYLASPNLDAKGLSEMDELHSQMQSDELLENYRVWLKVNNKFHGIFIDASQNSRLIQIIDENLGALTRYWYLACSFGFLKKSIHYHGQIIKNFKKKDEKSVRTTVEEHFFETGKDIREYLTKIMI
jgi:DNA-binding GntR family transcriptional regulator